MDAGCLEDGSAHGQRRLASLTAILRLWWESSSNGAVQHSRKEFALRREFSTLSAGLCAFVQIQDFLQRPHIDVRDVHKFRYHGLSTRDE
eukprot:SAG11_NODE_2368_length_3448_cov_12.401015_6_plen_90_part_00